MLKLAIENHILTLAAGDHPAILSGAHRVFFELAVGYQRDQLRQHYTMQDSSVFPEVITDTIEYLTSHHLPYETDTDVRALLTDMAAAQGEYERAVTVGAKTKKEAGNLPAIPHFKRKLTSYQATSVRHLLGVRHGAVFSVPGSGKTSVVFATFAILSNQQVVEKLLVIGPRSSFMPWEEEYALCFGVPPRSIRLVGTKGGRRDKYQAPEVGDIFLVTYQTAANDVNELAVFCQHQKVLLVLDESHNIKKFEGGVWSEAVLRISKFATRRAILTGTPIPNRLEDLWTQMTFLWPGKQMLGSREQFAALCDNKSWSVIKSAVKPFYTRTRKTELGLPAQRFNRIDVSMNPYQAHVYRALSHRILSELNLAPEDQVKLREWRKAKLVRLLQVASNPTLLAKRSVEFNVPPLSGEEVSVLQLLEGYPQYERPAKFEELVKLVRELTGKGHKVLVWTSFILNIHMLEKLMRDLEPLILYGGVAKDEQENEQLNREQQIRLFRESPNRLILIANPAACAESISLHRSCHHAIYLDRTFDCGRYMQSLDRIHRMGLPPRQLTNYYILKCVGTIDETIDRRLEEKQTTMRKLLEDDELTVGTFDTAEEYSVSESEAEEETDFRASIEDLRVQAEHSRMNDGP